MGDADCTYDFRDIRPFSSLAGRRRIRDGLALPGSIEDGAMPPLHRYFGTPLTTWILNVMFGTEIHRYPLRHARHHRATR